MVGFGTFEVRSRAACTGRNPKTGEELKIKAAKVAAFKAGATLKAAVSSGKTVLTPLNASSTTLVRCIDC